MRWRSPSERTQMILLSPIIAPLAVLMIPMLAGLWIWQKFCGWIAPSADWHPWFAWRPVQHYNDVDWIWLEWAERRWHARNLGCFYRFAGGQS